MGSSNWSASSYDNLQRSYAGKSQQQVFTQRTTASTMSPKRVQVRESRDSDAHPNSVAVLVGLDVTGSMGDIPENLIKNKLGTLMETLINHQVPDAHVMFAAIGDHLCDTDPLQVGQFEAGTDELNKCLTSIFIEGHGGGNGGESYPLAWFFAGRHTSIDCFEKRGEKGFLFTIGDENFHQNIDGQFLTKLMGYPVESTTAQQLLAEAQRTYEVFHIHVNHGGYSAFQSWKDLLGERLLVVDDANTIPELISSTVAVVRGANLQQVVSGFDANAAASVSRALAHVTTGIQKSSTGVVKL